MGRLAEEAQGERREKGRRRKVEREKDRHSGENALTCPGTVEKVETAEMGILRDAPMVG